MAVQTSYLVNKVFILLTLIAVIDFLVRNFGEVPDDYVENMMNAQSLLELIIIVTFLFAIVPMWVDRVKNAGIKRIILFSSLVAGILILALVFPEYTESASQDDMRLIIAGILIAFLAVYYIAGYIWGKKHAKKDGEDEQTSQSERTEDDPEQE